jgi:acyl carrier protein phosphodiesterase
MNYLAHAFLSGGDNGLLLGNFIADHLRGNDFKDYPSGIIEGIHLHRRIDSFTDAHAEFKKSKRVFYDGFEKYSGILVDIYFDYFLAKDFEKYSSAPLKLFSENVYEIYLAHQHILPKTSSGFLDYVVKNNIYNSYASLKGIETVLNHLSHRISHRVQLDHSIELFRENENTLQANFDVFFKDAVAEFLANP